MRLTGSTEGDKVDVPCFRELLYRLLHHTVTAVSLNLRMAVTILQLTTVFPSTTPQSTASSYSKLSTYKVMVPSPTDYHGGGGGGGAAAAAVVVVVWRSVKQCEV